MITFENGIAYSEGKPVLLKISEIEPLKDYKLRAEFTDGTVRIYDVSKLLGYEAFAPLKNEGEFKKVTLDHGVPTWKDANVDLSPETIYINGK